MNTKHVLASLIFLFILAANAASAKNCKKGCPCGNACIPCSKTCHVGSYSPPPPPPASHRFAPIADTSPRHSFPPSYPAPPPPVASVQSEPPAAVAAPSSAIPTAVEVTAPAVQDHPPPPNHSPKKPRKAPVTVLPPASQQPGHAPPQIPAVTPTASSLSLATVEAAPPSPSDPEPTAPWWPFAMLPLPVVGALLVRRHRRVSEEQRRKDDERRIADDLAYEQAVAERQRLERLVTDHPPIFDEDRAIGILSLSTQFVDDYRRLTETFDQLNTFQAADRWDSLASDLRNLILESSDLAIVFVAESRDRIFEFERTDGEPSVIKNVAGKAVSTLDRIEASRLASIELAMDLDDRIDATPNTKKSASATLRDLRAQKRELAAQKKEVRASMTEVRVEAKSAAESARPSAWAPAYTKRQAADERRQIRRAKDEMLRPHEDRIAAIDRLTLDLDRKISWVLRFGEEEASE